MPWFAGLLLAVPQVLAAIPWLAALDPKQLRGAIRNPRAWGILLAVIAGVGLCFGIFFLQVQDPQRLQFWGRIYGAVLQLQMRLSFFAIAFPLLLWLWPHGGAVALAAFREGVRQPMFLLIGGISLFFMVLSPFLSYFTFGEETKMVRELGYDLIMLASALFAVLAAAISISDEIEGRTAITVMSKPVSRRQFLVGKYVGILFAAMFLTALLSWVFDGVVWFKTVYEGDTIGDPPWLAAAQEAYAWMGETATSFVIGARIWFDNAFASARGVIFGFCQVMVLLAVAVALATRLPMIVNLVTCLVVFFMGHLAQVLVAVSQGRNTLINFTAKVFNTVLPGLEYFNFAPVLAQDIEPDPARFAIYTGSVLLYAVTYSIIALLLGLVLFEDRDLA